MAQTDGLWEFFCSIFTGLSEGVVIAKHFTAVILEVNHTVMSKVLGFLVNFFSTAWAGFNLLLVLIYTVLVSVFQFLQELLNFVQALFHLLWKFVLLIVNLLDLLFHVVESFLYFLWTGGKWTASTITKSAQTLSENGIGTWKYFVMSLREFTDSVIGGFTVIGQCAQSSAAFLCDSSYVLFEGLHDVLKYTDSKIRCFVVYCFDTSCFLVHKYILGLSRDTYLAVLICIASYLVLSKIFRRLCSQGLTFPLFHSYMSNINDDASDAYYEDYEGRMAEFSDDDYVDLSHDEENSENDDDFVLSDEETIDESDDDISDVESELEVDSSDESVTASEGDISEINIQLPKLDKYNDNRRSATPSRMSKNMTTQDLQRLIEDEKERRKCVVCQDHNKSVLILPCRHMCLCVRCGNQIARSRNRERRICPLCRRNIETIMDVFI